MEENGKLNDFFNEGENSQDSEKKSEYSQDGTSREETSTQLDESSQPSQENESKDEQKDAGEEVEEEKYDDSEINAKNLEILHNDINYGIVLAFIDKFGKHFSFKEIKFDQFEQNIINIRNLNKNLSDIFLNLLRNLSFGKYVRKEKFDYYMTKFTNRFSHEDAIEIEKSGYAKLKIESKITLIKNLLESQFDENQKLKQVIAEQTPDQNLLRTEPNGKDLNGLWYFVYMDPECSIRVFTINHQEMNEDLTSWKLVAKNLNDLKLLVEKLSTEPALEKLRSSKRYQEKYKKEAEQKEHSNESNVQSGTKAETKDDALTKDEDNKEVKIEIKETEAIKEEFKKESEDHEKIKEEIKEESLNEKKEEELETKSENKMENEPVQSGQQETKMEKIEPKNKIDEENDPKTQENDQSVPEMNDEIEVEPIALRKSTRSSVRKMQQIDQLKLTPTTKTTSKATPKSVKKSSKKTPKKKSPKKKNSTCVEYIEDELDDEEDIEEEDDDEEFAPSPSKKKTANSAKKKSGQKKKPNLLEYESGSTISDESDQESACVKCQKVKSKQILILCDGCDAPYHIGCLKPPLLEIPEGDWFCQVCAHDQLVRYLEQKISLIEHHNRQVDEARQKESQNQKRSYTDISTYLDNLFSSNAGRKIKEEKPKKSIFEETVLEGPRSCRLKSRVKYTFEDFDKSINQACGEEVEEEIGEPRPARTTRRSSRLNEYFDSFNSEAESDAGSNSSEYKAKIARPKYKSESEEMSEEEAEESDEDFNSGRKKPRNERANGKRAKNAKKRKTRSKYCDDSESEVGGTEEEEEEARFSDDEEYSQRFSRRKRRVYRELGDEESETISDSENVGKCKAKVRSTRTKSRRRNYCESSDEEGAKEERECEDKPKSRVKKARPSDHEECGDKVPAKKVKPIIKRPWSDEDSAESKLEKGGAGEDGSGKSLQPNGAKSSENENKSQVVNEAPRQSAVENKPIVLPAQNFVPNTFIATAAPMVYYYCQPTHMQPTPIIQMNGQIQNQIQPIVLMNIPSQSFIKPS